MNNDETNQLMTEILNWYASANHMPVNFMPLAKRLEAFCAVRAVRAVPPSPKPAPKPEPAAVNGPPETEDFPEDG